MSRHAQTLGPESARTAAPGRGSRSPARQAVLASRIGNRAMARLAVGQIPAGLTGGVQALQRDTGTDDKPDPKSGLWGQFQGKRSSDWVPLGNFSLPRTQGGDDDNAFIDILVDSPKGLHLGEALDNQEPITVVIEERQPHGKPLRQTLRRAVITSVSVTHEVNPTHPDPTGTYDQTTKRHVVRVGLRLNDSAPSGH